MLSVLEVEGERNDRKTLSVDSARPVFELVSVGQQLAASVVVVGKCRARVGVGRDVEADEPQLPLKEHGIGVLQLHLLSRSDFTSLPLSMMPNSISSRMSSRRATRLVATAVAPAGISRFFCDLAMRSRYRHGLSASGAFL